MRVLLTGAAGFIGSNVAHQLVEAGHSVVGIDNMNRAYDPRLKRWRLRQLAQAGRFVFRKADVTDAHQVAKLFAGARFDAVLNLAARAGVRQSITDPQGFLETNAAGALNLLEASRRHRVRSFVLASTSSLYGRNNPRPFREDADTSRPLSPYAASKRAAESLAASYAHLYDFNVAVLRYFTVYGPAGRPDMSIFRFVQRIMEGIPIALFGSGRQQRDFTFVSDIARGTVKAMRVKGFEIINLGSDAPITINSVIQRIEEHAGRPAKVRRRPAHPADVPATWASVDKARALLGWRPSVRFDEGLERTINWYHENRSWARTISTEDV